MMKKYTYKGDYESHNDCNDLSLPSYSPIRLKSLQLYVFRKSVYLTERNTLWTIDMFGGFRWPVIGLSFMRISSRLWKIYELVMILEFGYDFIHCRRH